MNAGYLKVSDPAGLAAYQMDSHNCQRIFVLVTFLNRHNKLKDFDKQAFHFRSSCFR